MHLLVKVLIVVVLVFLLFKRQPSNDPMILQVRKNFRKLDPTYGEIPIMEAKRGTFTENKSTIYLCVRDPKTGMYYDMNTIMYVALHELAHVLSQKEGHTQEFLTNFNILLKKAIAAGIYVASQPPNTYCTI